ncbi:hypothetical protein [Paenibacillus beijingensis]|uniref:hypothetical protein n=1 Tax=Paenibacillus beijingensis TaxID=1126833 RepID=UPI000696EFBD|nr:hypothetical protein [Paenibacillus beijingensis]
MNRIIESVELDPFYLNTENWPSVFIDNFSEKQKEIFQNRKMAIDLYMQNERTVKEICELTRMKRHHLVRLLRRCLAVDDHGNIWGYRALIPHKQLVRYNLKEFPKRISDKDQRIAGSFQLLLNRHPNIKELIDNLYLRRGKDTVHEPRIKVKNLHKRFLDECRSLGIKPTEYPFNTANLAKRSLERYVKRLELRHFSEGVKRHGEQATSYAKSTGIGEQNHPIIIRPFERVQFDGHRIDAMIAIVFNTPEGDELVEVMSRIWILAIIDVGTRAILGYHLCLNKEYSSFDVLSCIRNAIVPKKSIPLTIPGLQYNESGGFVSEKLPETQWALWDEFLLDNAKANLSTIVRDRLTQIVGCSINAGPVSTPVRRSLIERFFQTLEENGFHRLPSTTGSKPNDPRRRSPEEKAVQYKIRLADLEQLTEILISNYNGTPHTGTNNLTPLEVMEQRINKGWNSLKPQINFFKSTTLFDCDIMNFMYQSWAREFSGLRRDDISVFFKIFKRMFAIMISEYYKNIMEVVVKNSLDENFTIKKVLNIKVPFEISRMPFFAIYFLSKECVIMWKEHIQTLAKG